MSIKIMSLVYDSDLNKSETAILMAYADHANDDGYSVFPSIGRIAWKTKYTERAVQYITKTLVEKGVLVLDGTSRYQTNMYHININALPKRPPYEGGEKFTPLPVAGGEIDAGGGEIHAPGGEPLAPESSLTIIKPSEEEGRPPFSPIAILSKACGLVAFPPDQLQHIESIHSMVEAYGEEATIDAMRRAFTTWTSTARKDGRGTYKRTNLNWITWAMEELAGGSLPQGKDPSQMTDKEWTEWITRSKPERTAPNST